MLIPPHTNCQNCGTCCGIVPITHNEELLIRDHLATLDEETVFRLVAGTAPRMCQFRDHYGKRCAIYPVRPLICRLFGVLAPMGKDMECTYGNSYSLDMRLFLGDDDEDRYPMPRMLPLPTWKRTINSHMLTRRERRAMGAK